MNLIRDDVTHHVTKLGQPISFRRKQEILPPAGALYNVVNTNALTPAGGELNIPPTGLTLRINAVDADTIDRTAEIASLKPDDVISFLDIDGNVVSTCLVQNAPILNTGVFAVFVQSLPVAADGAYLLKATRT